MAASAKEKAYNLKDSYVAGLIEGGATAPAPTMPTQDMGEQASIFTNIDNNTFTATNDGDPHQYIKRGGRVKRYQDAGAAYPLPGSPVGYRGTVQDLPQNQYYMSNMYDRL